MPDPIARLQGIEEVPLPEITPQQPLSPEFTVQPQEAESPEPSDLAGGRNLPLVPLPTVAPAVEETPLNLTPQLTPGQQVSNITVPQRNAGVQQVIDEAVQADVAARNATEFPVLYEPPDLDGLITTFDQDSQENVARVNAQLRVDQSSNAQVAQQMLEALRRIPPAKGSSTSDGFDWVRTILGTTEDGVREYTTPATLNKKTGEWEGTPIGGILYALGLAQNSIFGAAFDGAKLFRDTQSGLSQLVNRYTPPWAKGLVPHYFDNPLVRLIPLAEQLNRLNDIIPNQNRYWDGKSNFVEALRGAQYSFSDEAGKGVGIKRNVGVRIGAAPGKGFGFDYNITVVGGVLLDVVVGAKLDKLVTRGAKVARLSKVGEIAAFEPSGVSIRGARTTLQGGKTVLQGAEATPVQLELPFLLRPELPVQRKAGKAPKPLAPPRPNYAKRAKPPQVIQQVLPIDQMLKEFADEERVLRPLAYKEYVSKRKDGQLSLELEVVRSKPPSTAVLAPTVLTPPKIPGVKKRQLTIKFDTLPEALPPKLASSVLPDLVPPTIKPIKPTKVSDILSAVPGDDLASAATRASLVNQAAANVAKNLDNALDAVDLLPDVGRKFTQEVFTVPPAPVKPIVGLPTANLRMEVFHGSRVVGLDIPAINPIQGAARSELGVGVYMHTDPKRAEVFVQADVNPNLPPVEGRTINPTGGEVHRLDVSKLKLINADKPSPQLRELADQVSEAFEDLRGVFKHDSPKSLIDVYDDVSLSGVSEATNLEFQRHFARAIVDSGYDGARTNNMLAIYNTSKVRTAGKQSIEGVVSAADAKAARVVGEQDAVKETTSVVADVNAKEAEASWLAQTQHDIDQLKPQLEADVQKTIDADGLMQAPAFEAGTQAVDEVVTAVNLAPSVYSFAFKGGDVRSGITRAINTFPQDTIFRSVGGPSKVLDELGFKLYGEERIGNNMVIGELAKPDPNELPVYVYVRDGDTVPSTLEKLAAQLNLDPDNLRVPYRVGNINQSIDDILPTSETPKLRKLINKFAFIFDDGGKLPLEQRDTVRSAIMHRYGLSQEQAAMLQNYGEFNYLINNALRGTIEKSENFPSLLEIGGSKFIQELKTNIRDIARVTSDAFRKLDPFVGTTYRGMSVSNADVDVIRKFDSQLETGVISDDAFTYSSEYKSVAKSYAEADGNAIYRFTIQSVSGVKMEQDGFKLAGEAGEVIFTPDVKFRVVSFTKVGNVRRAVLEEIPTIDTIDLGTAVKLKEPIAHQLLKTSDPQILDTTFESMLDIPRPPDLCGF
jgi:hypothetical protein